MKDAYKKAIKPANDGKWPKCQECPECVDCSQGKPLLRDGYTLGTTVEIKGTRFGVLAPENSLNPAEFPKPDQSSEPWQVYFAFFCDEDTAVTPAIMTEQPSLLALGGRV